MAVRDCIILGQTDMQENMCYDRNSQVGHQSLLNLLQDKLTFVGDVVVERFYGWQCYCEWDMCRNIISGTRRTSGYIAGLVLGVFVALFL